MNIELARCTTMCDLIKEIHQMRVRKSANDEAKVQLAKLYFQVKINQEYPRKEKKDNAALNKTLIKKKNSDF